MKNYRLWLRRSWIAMSIACIACIVFFHPSEANAAPRVEWKSRTLKENSKAWKVDMSIYFPKPPDMALMPVRFIFTPVVYYERSLMDGRSEPVQRKVPLQDKAAMVQGMDLGFLDPSTGKIESRTRFSFSLTRERGFEAGEYDVTIRDARTDQMIGTKTHIILEGENEIIDRRAMVFEDKKKEKPEAPKEQEEKAYSTSAIDPDDPAYWEGGPTEPEKKDEPLPPPTSMKERPGACGCRFVGEESNTAGLIGVLGLSLLLLRRRATTQGA